MLKEKIEAFVDGELHVIKEYVHSGFPKCSKAPEDEEESKQAKEALLVIIKHILRGSEQEKMVKWFSGLKQMNK